MYTLQDKQINMSTILLKSENAHMTTKCSVMMLIEWHPHYVDENQMPSKSTTMSYEMTVFCWTYVFQENNEGKTKHGPWIPLELIKHRFSWLHQDVMNSRQGCNELLYQLVHVHICIQKKRTCPQECACVGVACILVACVDVREGGREGGREGPLCWSQL